MPAALKCLVRLPFSYLVDGFGGHSGYESPGWHVFGDDTSGTDNGSFPNSYPFQYCYTKINPGMVSNDNGSCWNRPFFKRVTFYNAATIVIRKESGKKPQKPQCFCHFKPIVQSAERPILASMKRGL